MNPVYAKDRARLLREDLAKAGFGVPHSLALELIAHQQGFRDWNTLTANDEALIPIRPHLERDTYEHVSTAMTLGDLRTVIGGHPDETPVLVSQPEAPGSTTSSSIPAESAAVRPSLQHDRRPALVLHGNFQPGRYLVPRRLTIVLSGLPVGGGSVIGAVIDNVRASVDGLGFRGEQWMSNDDETGVVTWQFHAHAELPLSSVEGTVRRVVRRHDPGGWVLTFE